MNRTLTMLAPFGRDLDTAMLPLGHFFSGARHRPWNRQLAELEHDMKAMDREFDRLEREVAHTVGGAAGHTHWPLNPRIEPHVVTDGDKKKYLLNVNMGKDFAPENLKMTIKDNVMTINAKKEEVSEDGHHRMYQEVSRRFTLPQGVDPKHVTSHLDAHGVLKIEAPLPQNALPAPPAPKPIPIDVA